MKSSPCPPQDPQLTPGRSRGVKTHPLLNLGQLVFLRPQNSLWDEAELSQHLSRVFTQLSPAPILPPVCPYRRPSREHPRG